MTISIVFAFVFLLLYLGYNIILRIFGKSSSSFILYNTINRITVIPIYVLLFVFGIALFAICPFLILLKPSDDSFVYAPLYCSVPILFIYLIVSVGQCLGVVKSYKMGQLQKGEAIIYSICSFIPFAGIVIGFVSFARSLPKESGPN